MCCLTVDEKCHGLLCRKLLRDQATPGKGRQITVNKGEQDIGQYLQHSSLSGVAGSIGGLEPCKLAKGVEMSLEMRQLTTRLHIRRVKLHIRRVKLSLLNARRDVAIFGHDLLKSSARYSEIRSTAALSSLVGSGLRV